MHIRNRLRIVKPESESGPVSRLKKDKMTKADANKLGLSYRKDGSLWDGGSGKWVVKYDWNEVGDQMKCFIENGQAFGCKLPYGPDNKPTVFDSREEARQAFLSLPQDLRSERRWRISELSANELSELERA